MEVADFVAESDEEESAVGVVVEGSELAASEKWRQAADPGLALPDEPGDRERKSEQEAAVSRSVVKSAVQSGSVRPGSDERAALEAERSDEGVGTIHNSSIDVEAAAPDAPGGDTPCGSDDDDEDGENNSDREGDHEADGLEEIGVGSVVEVEARTWPGINKLGGTGRVAAVHRELAEDGKTELVLYDVRYMIGGFDKRVESEFVQLQWKVHQEAKRSSIPREFYHDQYINEPQKKRLRMTMAGHSDSSGQHRHKQKPTSTRTERSPRPRERATVAISNSALLIPSLGDDDRIEDDQDARMAVDSGLRRVDDGAFLLHRDLETIAHNGSSSSTSGKLTADKPRKKTRDRQRKREKERARAVRSDSQASVAGYHAHAATTDDRADVQDRHGKQRRHREANRGDRESTDLADDTLISSRKRKRRYVGGYHHGGDDPDATFIQPEDNPTALPDDVARETQFVLADSKEGLQKQVQERWKLFNENLAKLAQERASLESHCRDLDKTSVSEVRNLYRKLTELEEFIKREIIRGGEDVLNTLIKELSRRRAPVLESMELSFDRLVREELPDTIAWVRSAIASVEAAFNRQHNSSGVRLEFDKEESFEDSDFSDLSSESDSPVDAPVVDNEIADFVSNGYETGYFDEDKTPQYRRRKVDDGSRLARRRPALQHAPVHHNGRARARTSTKLDDFYDSFPGGSTRSTAAIQTNFRMVGQRARLPDLWNWKEISKKKWARSRAIGAARSGLGSSARANRVVSSGSLQLNKASTKDTSGAVHSAVVQMRNERYRSQSRAYQPQQRQQQSIRMTSRSSLGTLNSFEPSELTPPFQHKRLREEDRSNNTMGTADPSRTSWELVFDVIPESWMHPTALLSSQTTLLLFGHWITNPLAKEQLQTTGFAQFALARDEISYRASKLRQQLTDLRQLEFEVLETLPSGARDRDEGDVEQSSAWRALTALGDAYHRDIAGFCVGVLSDFKSVDAKSVLDILSVVLEELVQSLRQLPDCESLFIGCPEYFFYFDVEALNAKTTPLLSAVTRTYWYILQLVFALQRDCDKLQCSEQLKKSVHDLLGPSVDWSVRAAMLFLKDWYLYLPSSHTLPEDAIDDNGETLPDDNPSATPALSLWLSLFRCYQGDDETPSLATDGKTRFWTSFKKLYCDNHITRLSRHFIRGESPGGYWADPPQPTVSPVGTPDDEEDMQTKLLGLDSTWDVLMTLMGVLGEETLQVSSSEDECKWGIVRHLLHMENEYFLPFSAPATVSTQDRKRYFGPHTVKTLQRVVWVSKILPPDAATVQAILEKILSNTEPELAQSIFQLPEFFRHFSSEWSQARIAPTSDALLQCIDGFDHNALAVLCQIILTQLGRHEKPIARRRFRQPIFQVIQAAIQDLVTPVANAPPGAPNNQPALNRWVWEKRETTSSTQTASSVSNSPSKPTSRQAMLEKKQICISVLLIFAVDSLELVPTRGDAGIEPNKNRKREVEFYCKEILKVGGEGRDTGCTVMTSQALYVMGAPLVKVSVEYPGIFMHMDKLLMCGLENARRDAGEIPDWNQLLRDERKHYRVLDARISGELTVHEQRFRTLQGAILSSLHLLRDLTSELCASVAEAKLARSAEEVKAAKVAYDSIISSGLDGCFTAAIDSIISVEDLNIAIEILQLVIPRCQDVPIRSKRVIPVDDQIREAMDDEFYASMDMDALTGETLTAAVALSIDTLRPHAIGLVGKNLRLGLQKLVLRYPEFGTFQELFAIDLLGMVISTGEVPFSWDQVTRTSLQPRYLASRLFSAAIKYNPEQEWFCNSFLSNPNSDQELANLWMMTTVNTSMLDPTPLTFRGNKVTFSIAQNAPAPEEVKVHPSHQTRDSNCWVMLTDGIVYNILRKDEPTIRSMMHPLLFDLLYRVASTCQLPRQLWLDPSATVNASKLYALHLDVFQAFAKSTGGMWHSFVANPAAHRESMTKLRSITAGIFPTFIRAYEINLQDSCVHIAGTATNLFAVLDEFTSAFAPESGKSFHDIDDMVGHHELGQLKYPAVRALITMLRFLYQCVDALFFYCGDMAIGHNNLFTVTLDRLFTQAVTAESSHAQRRLAVKTPVHSRLVARGAKKDDLFQGCEPFVVRFVQSVQLFFAREKYPAVLHWFASTSRTYLTFTPMGWPRSQLRTLLVNALDPEGPLGIHSYYPMEDKKARKRRFDVKDVRREAFYLACGLFVCRCTNSFEHCKTHHDEMVTARSSTAVREMRLFLLSEFVRESVEFASEMVGNVDETLLPLLQFLRATLNHVNLNRRQGGTQHGADNSSHGATTGAFDMREIQAGLEWITLYVARVLAVDDAIQNPLWTVLLIEYCGIVREATEVVKSTGADESTTLMLQLALDILKSTNESLCKSSGMSLASVAQHSYPRLAERLSTFNSSVSTAAGFEMTWIARAEQESRKRSTSAPQPNSYGISASRARADLLVTIRQVLQSDQQTHHE